MRILVLNAGSSSHKSCLYALTGDTLPDQPLEPLWSAQIDWTHQQDVAKLKVQTAQGVVQEEQRPSISRFDLTWQMLLALWSGKTQVLERSPESPEIDIVGHRIVHGGQKYRSSTIVSPPGRKIGDRPREFTSATCP